MYVATITCTCSAVPIRCHGDIDDDGGGGVSCCVSCRADHRYCTCKTLQQIDKRTHTHGNIIH